MAKVDLLENATDGSMEVEVVVIDVGEGGRCPSDVCFDSGDKLWICEEERVERVGSIVGKFSVIDVVEGNVVGSYEWEGEFSCGAAGVEDNDFTSASTLGSEDTAADFVGEMESDAAGDVVGRAKDVS